MNDRSQPGPSQADRREVVGGVLSLFEVKHATHAVRGLRAAFLDLAYQLEREPDAIGYLVLVDSRITPERLADEIDQVRRVLHTNVGQRLRVVTYEDGEWMSPYGNLGEGVQAVLEELAAKETPPGSRLPRPDYDFEILKALVLAWLRGRGPITTLELTKTVGCSYPTAAKVIDRLGRVITRRSDRRVELARFPTAAWTRALASSDRLRSTVFFIDRSGRPKPPDSLIRRLERMSHPEVAVGGAPGARHWYPDLDLVGTPRLDLTVHCPGSWIDLGFVRRLDPALAAARGSEQPPAVAIHLLRRADARFAGNGTTFADPVECLLDLHEMRLEQQAGQFIEGVRAIGQE